MGLFMLIQITLHLKALEALRTLVLTFGLVDRFNVIDQQSATTKLANALGTIVFVEVFVGHFEVSGHLFARHKLIAQMTLCGGFGFGCFGCVTIVSGSFFFVSLL
jgi:hypothetical protein